MNSYFLIPLLFSFDLRPFIFTSDEVGVGRTPTNIWDCKRLEPHLSFHQLQDFVSFEFSLDPWGEDRGEKTFRKPFAKP